MPGNPNITVDVVVNGVGTPVTINGKQTVEQLIREALREAEQPHGGDLSGWQLRPAEGNTVFDFGQRVSEAGIADGAKLFLSKDAGGGG
jgi:hypothetical protein